MWKLAPIRAVQPGPPSRSPNVMFGSSPGKSHSTSPNAGLSSVRVWADQRIVEAIVEFAVGKEYYGCSTPRQRLRSLTIVSRNFFIAASSVLWREMDSILPLFALLPQSEPTERVLTRPLKQDDFNRWRVYAPLVRKVTMEHSGWEEQSTVYPSSQALALLSAYQAASGEALFPTLETLVFCMTFGANELACITLLASLSVRNLTISLPDGACTFARLETALRYANETMPKLNTLLLMASLPLDRLWPILSNFPFLRKVNLTFPNDYEDVVPFLRLPALEEGCLTLFDQHCDDTFLTWAQISTIIYKVESGPEGKTVQLSGSYPLLLSSLPAVAQFPKISTLALSYRQPRSSEPRASADLVKAVAKASSNVCDLSLEITMQSDTTHPRTLLMLATLPKLQKFQLSIWCINGQKEPPMAEPLNRVFHDICLSASRKEVKLTSLRIMTLYGLKLGLDVLKDVRDHLPCLSILELPIDSSSGYHLDSERLLQGSRRRHPLHRFSFDDSRKEEFKQQELRVIAMFLNRAFPDLLDLVNKGKGFIYSKPKVEQGWEIIGDLLKGYQSANKG